MIRGPRRGGRVKETGWSRCRAGSCGRRPGGCPGDDALHGDPIPLSQRAVLILWHLGELDRHARAAVEDQHHPVAGDPLHEPVQLTKRPCAHAGLAAHRSARTAAISVTEGFTRRESRGRAPESTSPSRARVLGAGIATGVLWFPFVRRAPTPGARERRGDGLLRSRGRAHGDARFDWKKVADGVHVAVAAPAYKVNSNTAIIESDDGVLVVDTHSKPSAARVIVDTSAEITSTPVRYVVNTHFHWDHWHGNEVYPAAYPGAEIVTNQITREAMVKKGLKRIQDHVRQVPAEIAKLEAELAAAAPARGSARARGAICAWPSRISGVRALKPALPTIAFEQTMKLYRRDREIHLLYLGRAHTEGDVFVYLPRRRS